MSHKNQTRERSIYQLTMAAVTLLPASLQNAMQEIVERTSQSGAGIRAVLLSTTEGVPLGRVYAGDEPLNEEVLATLESVWAPASKQIPALGMEKVHQVTAIYDHGTLIHVYQAPVVCI
jgi:predicted regulator of Ras-like GTPase activity (Roadblock/LC7/MglB family)